MKKLAYPKPIKRIKTKKLIDYFPEVKAKILKIKVKNKLNKVRKTPVGTLERRAWKIFSEYIRARDARKSGSLALDWLKCYTCGRDVLTKEAHAGHYIVRGKHATKFDERNVHAQCSRCNVFLHGNLIPYTLALQQEYGVDFPAHLIAKSNTIHKFTREELEGIITDSLVKIRELDISKN